MKIGRKEIRKALDSITLTKKEYQGYEIDTLILQYYNLPEDVMLEDVTESSNEFEDIAVVYDFIDDILREKG